MIEVPQPDPRPAWLIDKQAEGTGLNSIIVDGIPYPYTLVRPKVIKPEFPYSVGMGSKTGLYISTNVPSEDRDPILIHEVREAIRFTSIPEDERCRYALAAELREIQLTREDRDYRKYVGRRTAYFNSLLWYYQAPEHAAGVTPQFYDGLLTAGGYINFIAAGLNKK